MNIELKPKYEIGQKIARQIVSSERTLFEDCFVIVDIRATYIFSLQDIKYEYKLEYDNGNSDEHYIYGWEVL